MFESCDDYMEMTGAQYKKLYARYVNRNLDELILAAGPVEGKRVLDICAGSGVVAVRAKELGASFVMAHDRSRKMMEGIFERGVDVVSDERGQYTIVFPDQHRESFDLVICRQAVNYWWCFNGLAEVLAALKHGGHFVFNTFHGDSWTDPHHPTTQEYEIDGVYYAETHWLVNGSKTIHHVQCCEGMPPHCTEFRFITRGMFQMDFDEQPAVKDWSVERKGNADIYIVERA